MKTLMLTTALAGALALPAFAKDPAQSDLATGPFLDSRHMGEMHGAMAPELRASDLIGMRIYTTENDVRDEDRFRAEAVTDWNDIGEVNDVLLSRDGKLEAVLLDIGGFLGIGERTVAVQMDELRFVADEDDAGDYFIVFTASRAQLEAAPEYDTAWGDDWTSREMETRDDYRTFREREAAMLGSRADMGHETTADGDMTKRTDADGARKDGMTDADVVLIAPTVERDGYSTAAVSELTASDVTGAVVYDLNDEAIGEVSELVLETDGAISKAVLDIGGFLGIGEKSVAMNMESLTIKRSDDGSDLRIYVDATEADFERMEAWNG